MKPNSIRYSCDADKLGLFFKNSVPTSLKVPAFGKYIVYTHTSDPWSIYNSLNSDNDIEEFTASVHMISAVSLRHPKPRFTLMDNVKSIKVLVGDSYREIMQSELNDWLYCSVSEKLKDKCISLTGVSSMYSKATYEHLTQLSGGTYSYKTNSKTDLLINCSSCSTKALNYAKKHNIKIISEIDFFKLLA